MTQINVLDNTRNTIYLDLNPEYLHIIDTTVWFSVKMFWSYVYCESKLDLISVITEELIRLCLCEITANRRQQRVCPVLMS